MLTKNALKRSNPRGRPPADTVPMTLRVPRDLMRQLVMIAAKASEGSERVVSAQSIVLEYVEKGVAAENPRDGIKGSAERKAPLR